MDVTKECIQKGLERGKTMGLPLEIWVRQSMTMPMQTVTPLYGKSAAMA